MEGWVSLLVGVTVLILFVVFTAPHPPTRGRRKRLNTTGEADRFIRGGRPK